MPAPSAAHGYCVGLITPASCGTQYPVWRGGSFAMRKHSDMRTFDSLGKKKVVIGMVHLLPLPGTPFYQEGNVERALPKAVADATALDNGGADGCLLQTGD